MPNDFSIAELKFVENGGNLWYVEKVPHDGWDVVRWSITQGHRVVVSAAPSEDKACRHLWRVVCPSSFRTNTIVYHRITRPAPDKQLLFPNLV